MFGAAGHLPELVIILVIGLLVLGPGKLPQVGSAFGKTIREFRKGATEAAAEEEAEAEHASTKTTVVKETTPSKS